MPFLMTTLAFTLELPGPNVFNTAKPNWSFVTVVPSSQLASNGPLTNSGFFSAPGGTGSAGGSSAVGPPGRIPTRSWYRSAYADSPVTATMAAAAPTTTQSRVFMVYLLRKNADR